MSDVLIRIPLVGMQFRPPANQVLEALPLGTSLILRAEPSNEYDPNAVQVLVNLTSTPTPVHIMLAALVGENTAEVLITGGMFHIGYLARSGAKTAKGGPGNVEALLMASGHPQLAATYLDGITARLGYAAEGHPMVVITRNTENEEPIL